MNSVENVKPLLKSNNWTTFLSKKRTVQGVLLINLYQGSDIMSADDNGLCDPFIKFYYYGKSIESKVVDNSLNPIWN